MKLVFHRGPVYTSLKLENVPYSDVACLLSAVRRVTSARPSGYQHMPAYRNRTWDGYIHLYKGNRFPTGLLVDVVESVLGVMKIEIEIVDEPGRCNDFLDILSPDMFDGITLRSYQQEAIIKLMQCGRGIAKMATNSGKTEVIAAICKCYPGRILVFTTKRDLMHQTAERLSLRLSERVGCIGDGVYDRQRVTVAMIQSLCKHDNLGVEFKDVGCVMFDECHHVPSKTSQKVLLDIPAWNRFGFSGTPLHYNDLADLMLIGATGPVLVEVTNADLIEAGISSKPCVDMYAVDSDSGFEDKWAAAYERFVVTNDNRNRIIAEQVKAAKADATLILVDRLEHGRILKSMIPKSLFANGSMSTDERRRILDKLRKGRGCIVIATPIFDEGVDVPSVDLLVLAAGGLTHIRILQRIGRGMRMKESLTLRVIDFVDDTNKYLLEHSEARARLYEEEGFIVRVVE